MLVSKLSERFAAKPFGFSKIIIKEIEREAYAVDSKSSIETELTCD